ASPMMAAIAWTVRSAMEQRSRPVRRLEASLNAASDWTPRVALPNAGLSLAASALVFIITVLLPMRLFSGRRCAGICCAEDLVERFDDDFDVFSFEDERRKEAKDRLAGSVDDDV